MKKTPALAGLSKTLLAYGTAVVLCLVILVLVMKLWKADLSVPFEPLGDSLFYQALTKGLIDNGWWLHNDQMGAPFGQQMEDFPIADNLHFLVLKLISLANHDAGFVYNAFFLLTFPLTTLTSLWVLRRLNIAYLPALVVSLLYAFLPYHFLRGEAHLFLGTYYLIPPMVLVLLQVYRDGDLLFRRDEQTRRIVWNLVSWRSLATLGFCFIFSAAGVYYAFFACFFLLIAALTACFARWQFYPLVRAAVLGTTISAGLLVTLAPTLLYKAQHGPNREAVARTPLYAEIYGLKIDHMLMPVTGHRLGILARAKAAYMGQPVMSVTNNENTYSALGIVSSIGFLILTARLLYPRPGTTFPRLLDGLTLLNVFAVLLATIGGFGAVLALLGLTWIRGYCRIVVYIAFFALVAVALLLDRFAQRYVKSARARLLYIGALACLLVVGILDQTSKSFVPDYPTIKAEYQVVDDFVGQIEASVPAGAMVFQLPYTAYPEGGHVNKMFVYEHLRAYFHSRHLRWSYGAMKGRDSDIWQRTVAEKPLGAMIEDLAAAGFSGIYLDRHAYKDNGTELVGQISDLLGAPIESANKRLVFFNMSECDRHPR